MLRIFQFLYRIRAFFLFILLEVGAIGIIISNNSPQGAAFLNSSNAVFASLMKKKAEVTQYFYLAKTNKSLENENLELIRRLIELESKADSMPLRLDLSLSSKYQFRGAKVIANSLRFSQNHITLSKGVNDGIKIGMGVFNEEGVVGRIKSV